jgi:PhzF family phenazine biosynthesis protein
VSSEIPLFQVDAFTSEPFKGNPAAVCLLHEARDADWMQHVAAEMNLSETAFLVRRDPGDGFDLRWFTPTTEADLCGHATLASAHVLWEEGVLGPEETARFHTKSGWLAAARNGEEIVLDFPATPPEEAECPPELTMALGVPVPPRFCGKSRFDYFLEAGDEAAVRALRPDHAALARTPVRGVIVTAKGAAPYDFVSRFFAPGSGVAEDPVTGSAHCALGPYWMKKLGKPEILAYQASARGGVVRVRVRGERVELGGRAVTVVRGRLSA